MQPNIYAVLYKKARGFSRRDARKIEAENRGRFRL